MTYFAIILSVSLIIAGCGPGKFTITETDDSFRSDKSRLILSENNRISSKSIVGGAHIDNTGVFLNPFVSRQPVTEKIQLLGIRVTNITQYSTLHGGPNQLGNIQRMVFKLPDGSLIEKEAFDASKQTSDTASYNSLTRSSSIDIIESGTFAFSPAELKQVAFAPSLSCKLIGSKQSVIYDESDITDGFIGNIKLFYTTEVAPYE